jgi:hypothetical protein
MKTVLIILIISLSVLMLIGGLIGLYKDIKEASKKWPPSVITVKPIFAWYDLWVGFFYDKKKKWLYFFPVPMFGIIIKINV